MSTARSRRCPGCSAELPKIHGPTHRYIGASPACWRIFSDLLNAGEPPLAPAPTNTLIGDAYAAQHPGTPSDQAIQSVAVHLLVLHGVLARGVAPSSALWVRRRGLRDKGTPKRGRYRWLDPPPFDGSPNVSYVAAGPDPVGTCREGARIRRGRVEGVGGRARTDALGLVRCFRGGGRPLAESPFPSCLYFLASR